MEKTNAIHLGGNLVHGFSMDETQVHGFDANLFQQSKMFGAGRWQGFVWLFVLFDFGICSFLGL